MSFRELQLIAGSSGLSTRGAGEGKQETGVRRQEAATASDASCPRLGIQDDPRERISADVVPLQFDFGNQNASLLNKRSADLCGVSDGAKRKAGAAAG
jgi:hypothetical protein